MSDITLKDYWAISLDDGWIKVDERVANWVRGILNDKSTLDFITLTDMFGSECFIKKDKITQVFHLNEDILRSAAKHSNWARSLDEE